MQPGRLGHAPRGTTITVDDNQPDIRSRAVNGVSQRSPTRSSGMSLSAQADGVEILVASAAAEGQRRGRHARKVLPEDGDAVDVTPPHGRIVGGRFKSGSGSSQATIAQPAGGDDDRCATILRLPNMRLRGFVPGCASRCWSVVYSVGRR